MKERFLGFLFCAILLAFAMNLALDKIHARFFGGSLAFQHFWYIPFVAVPAALLLALGWWMGFYRRSSERLGDALALGATALIVYLTLGAGYSCWQYCF